MTFQPASMADQAVCHIDGFGPLAIVAPRSVTELADCVRCAATERKAVYPLGGRTMLELGLPPTKPGIAVDLRGLEQVIDYPSRDMTITVQAGITIAKLQAILSAEHQQLPVDVPLPEQATLGGAIAVNASGPRRYGYGTLRDYVIGISFINGEGQEVKAGGRVVKNVAGYDLMKLHIGALGTLGIVTQVTLKLKPGPEMTAYSFLGWRAEAIKAMLSAFQNSRNRPTRLELLNPAAVRSIPWMYAHHDSPSWILGCCYEGNKEAVNWQVAYLNAEQRLIAGRDEKVGFITATARDFPQPAAFKRNFRDTTGPDPIQLQSRLAAKVTFKANVLPSSLADFCLIANGLSSQMPLQAHAGSGIVIGHLPDDLTREQAATMLTTLLDQAAAAEGNLVILRCPTELKRELPIWGKPRGDAWLMRRVKEALDSRGVFNPGRFVDGI
jgi:glycolate oxidase FAD binding subunit